MKLLWFTIITQIMDFYTFINVKSELIAANETSPIPKIYGQVPGAIISKIIILLCIWIAWNCLHNKKRNFILIGFSVLGIVGAISNIWIGW